jgi:hypothetical protein
MVRILLTGIAVVISVSAVVWLVYTSSVERARVVTDVSGAEETTQRAIELVLERGAIGDIGG